MIKQISKATFKKIIGELESIVEESEITESTISEPIIFKKEDIEKFLPDHYLIEDEVLLKICISLNMGKNIIFSGPPGTGKTTLAKAVLKAAKENNWSNNTNFITTATSDWSSYDTVGGYFPSEDNSIQLEFNPGIILSSIKDNSWIIIDELNRADIDKAIGQFISILEDRDIKLMLPFQRNGEKIVIQASNVTSSDTEYNISDNWRILATMNDLDKMSLYEMSYAFTRRFAVIDIFPPEENELRKILLAIDSSIAIEIIDSIVEVYSNCKNIRSLGPSIFIDMLKYIIYAINNFALDTDRVLIDAFNLFVRPQLLGQISTNKIKKIQSKIISNLNTDLTKTVDTTDEIPDED